MENNNASTITLKWYHYIAAFFAALFLTNFIPHFVAGVCGDPFPSPFSDPPGKGLSSPIINVWWALANLVVGYLLLRVSKINSSTWLGLLIFFIGIVLMSVNLSVTFTDKMR